eukprot:Sdes_comp22499_c0_seq1m20949
MRVFNSNRSGKNQALSYSKPLSFFSLISFIFKVFTIYCFLVENLSDLIQIQNYYRFYPSFSLFSSNKISCMIVLISSADMFLLNLLKTFPTRALNTFTF